MCVGERGRKTIILYIWVSGTYTRFPNFSSVIRAASKDWRFIWFHSFLRFPVFFGWARAYYLVLLLLLLLRSRSTPFVGSCGYTVRRCCENRYEFSAQQHWPADDATLHVDIVISKITSYTVHGLGVRFQSPKWTRRFQNTGRTNKSHNIAVVATHRTWK